MRPDEAPVHITPTHTYIKTTNERNKQQQRSNIYRSSSAKGEVNIRRWRHQFRHRSLTADGCSQGEGGHAAFVLRIYTQAQLEEPTKDFFVAHKHR